MADTKSFEEIQQLVLEKAAGDAAFRASLLADPRAAIAEAAGLDIPATVNFKAVEVGPQDYLIVLPPARADGELSDEDLESVAGGAGKDRFPPSKGSCYGGPSRGNSGDPGRMVPKPAVMPPSIVACK